MNLLLRSLFLLALTSGIAISQDAETQNAPDFSSLQGCWQTTGDETVIEEQWMAPRSGMMLGMSRTIRNDQVQGYEFLKIHDTGDGVTLTAWPSGQDEATFRLVRYARNQWVTIAEESPYGDDLGGAPPEVEWVFENPDHDFPKRIVYRVSPTSIRASIHATTEEDDRGDEGRRIDFHYERVACPE